MSSGVLYWIPHTRIPGGKVTFSKMDIAGFKVSGFPDTAMAAQYIIQKKAIAVSVNAEVLIHSHEHLREIVNEGIGYADGLGAVLGARACGYGPVKKIAGVELWLEVLRTFGVGKVYLIGAKPEVVSCVARRIGKEYPLLDVVGFSDGYFNEGQQACLINDIALKQPDIVVIATGQPRQELLAKKIFNRFPAIFLCVGGAFDVYAGHSRRAPKWLIQLGLEWLYRLAQEPSRYKRYMKLIRLFPLLFELRWNKSRNPSVPKHSSDIGVQ